MKSILFSLFAFVIIASSCQTSSSQDSDPIPVHDSLKIQSSILGEERTINIWLPPEYKTGTDSFPIIYMPDGGIVGEDFPHIANTLAELIAAKKIPPVILVGIANIQRRKDLSPHTEVESDKKIAPVVGGADKFRQFIKTELMPTIEKQYRTKVNKGILGESLAGLFVTETLFTEPELFDFYIAFDPSIWWNDHYLVTHAEDLIAKWPQGKKLFWFAGSDAKDIKKWTKSLSEKLEKAKPANLIWTYSPEPKEQHNTIFRATKEKAFIWIFSQQ